VGLAKTCLSDLVSVFKGFFVAKAIFIAKHRLAYLLSCLWGTLVLKTGLAPLFDSFRGTLVAKTRLSYFLTSLRRLMLAFPRHPMFNYNMHRHLMSCTTEVTLWGNEAP
jgi:hypothetical protein